MYKQDYNAIKDYINSLNIFDKCIELTYLKTCNKSGTIIKTATLSEPIPDTNKDIIATARQMAINLWGSL